MFAMISLKNPASTIVLFAVVVSAATQSSAHSAYCGSRTDAVAALGDWWLTQSMSATGVMATLIGRFTWPTWGPPWSFRAQVDPMWAP